MDTRPNDLVFTTGEDGHEGLTKREMLAAIAMQGLLANSRFKPGELDYPDYAGVAVKSADALIVALNGGAE